MKKIGLILVALAFIAMLATAGMAFGQQWGSGPCPSVDGIQFQNVPLPPSVTYAQPRPVLTNATKSDGYKWWARADNPNVLCLWNGDVKIGELDPDKATFKFAFDSSTIDLVKLLAKPKVYAETPAKAGVEEIEGDPNCPQGMEGCKVEIVKDGVDGQVKPHFQSNFGVNRPPTKPGEHVYSLSGRKVGAAEAMEALSRGAGSIPDDAGLPRLTVIGSTQSRKKVLDDINSHPSLSGLKGKVVLNQYSPDHWRVRDGGFVAPVTADGVQIYAQKPDGTVLWREQYTEGPDGLAKALRDKVPGYDPLKDPQPAKPDPAKPDVSPLSLGSINPLWLLIAVGGVVLLVMRKRS